MVIDASAQVHPTAIISDGARVGAECKIGPYCVVGPEVTLADRVELISHVAVAGVTSVGEATRIFPFASIGHEPQDLKFGGERSELRIGARNRIREHCTMNPGTVAGGNLTTVGDDCLFMMSTHVAHDCIVGNRVIMANNAGIAGHVEVGDGVIIGGQAAVHQFVRLGRGAMIGGLAGVAADVIPHGVVTGERASLTGLNLVGLKRAKADREDINGLRAAFRELFSDGGSLDERAEAVRVKYPGNPLVEEVLTFVDTEGSRSLTVPPAG